MMTQELEDGQTVSRNPEFCKGVPAVGAGDTQVRLLQNRHFRDTLAGVGSQES